MTHNTHKTTHSTMPAILPAILTGLFILTACGGGALPNDGKIAPNTQNDACKTNPLAEDCQNHAKSTQFIGQQTGFLSVGARGSDEDTANQEAESSVAPVVNTPVEAPASTPAPTPVVKKTAPVLGELAASQTAPTPAPTTSVSSYDFVPETSYSTYSSPAPERSGSAVSGDSGASGQQSTPVTAALITGRQTTRDTATPKNEFLAGGADELDRGDAPRGDPLRMNLNQAYYDGAKIGGDVGDGIDFFIVNDVVVTGEITYHENGKVDADGRVITSTRYHYAGILSGTDLGAPVATSGVTATWYGSFRTYNTNAVDFELTVGFGTTEQDRTISAFVKDTAWSLVDNYYFLEGTYGTNGLITATVNWGEFTGRNSATPKDGRLKNGTLTGLIGAQGAVGVFISDNGKNAETSDGYAGGFVASASLPEERVTYRDWAESFDDPTTGGVLETPSLRAEVTGEDDGGDDTFTNQFLGNSEYSDTLDETGAGMVTQRGGLTLADDVDSGVSFFSNGISLATLTDGSQSFAGLLAGTDLGAPLTDASLVGEWQGQFKSIGGYYFGASPADNTRVETAVDTDFTLTVTFGGGTGTLSAYVPIDEAGRHFYLTGTYNDKGVITGDVRAANFNNIGKPTTTVADDANGNGVLTGLIGAEGAVGAFISNADNYNYAGGFVATYVAPPFVVPDDDNLNLVTYSDWVRGQELIIQERLPFTADTATPKNEFLAIRTGDTALDETGLATSSTTRRYSIDLTTIGRTVDGTGGFSIFTHGGFAYAGILPNTDLGAPLGVKDVETTWRGAFYAVGGYEIDVNGGDTSVNGPFIRPADFELEITFGGTDFGAIKGSFEISPTSLASQARGNVHFLLEGTFNAGGYITGTVNFGKFDVDGAGNISTSRAPNGVLTGIIGKNGAVGSFISNPVPADEPSTGDRNFIYSGGFAVARDSKPNYATFREFYTPRSDTRELHATHPATRDAGRFIEGTPTGLVTDNFDLTGNGYGPAVVRLGEVASEHADYDSGFAVMRSTNNRYRVGLLSGTDLGAALDASVKANWSGKIYRLTHTVRSGSPLTSDDLTLTVDFANGTIKTTDATVNGRFRAGGRNTDLPFGILDGSVNYGSVNVLAGLIGEKGVLGVFHGGVNGLHAGGFYATPDEETVGSTYKTEPTLYSHWVTSFNTGGVNAGETLRASGVDISTLGAGSNDYITLGAGNVIVLTGANDNGNLVQDTLMLDGSAVSGVVFGVEEYDGQSFVGLLPTTNVGGAITAGPAKAIWRGSLKGLSGYGFETLSSDSFNLEVAFGAGEHAGTIKSLFNAAATDPGPAFVAGAPNNTMNFVGDFNAAGVMWGTVAAGGTPNGVFSGLIGENGAVGAFKGEDSGTGSGYAGGFVVKPPSN